MFRVIANNDPSVTRMVYAVQRVQLTAWFLIYADGEWRWVDAKLCRPVEENREGSTVKA